MNSLIRNIFLLTSFPKLEDAFMNPVRAQAANKNCIADSCASSTALRATKEELKEAQGMVDELLLSKNCGPVMVRLGWHDSGTFDKSLAELDWPKAGGAVGSIRFQPEIDHGANNGLAGAIKLLEPIKTAIPSISYADLFQMASIRAIELAGGPKIPVRYGRVDVTSPEDCSIEGNLPDAEASPETGKYGGREAMEDTTPNGHLRKIFYRMGLNDEEIVALSGAHTIGRAYKDRSGLGKETTKFTDGSSKVYTIDGNDVTDKFTKGGQAWTEQWLQFDNSYFKVTPDPDADPDLLKLSTDKALFVDEGFRPFAEKFRDSQEAFFESYSKAHSKLSELGSKFDPVDGITLN